ncbi:MAG: ABC transporter ATP-binding protein [Chitinophagaceae bacterium]
MIRVSQLSKAFRHSDEKTAVLNNVSFNIEKGEFVSIMGPSGSGKSTLLNILGLLDRGDSGKVELMGESLESYGENKLAAIRKNQIGFIFQSFNLIDQLTVYENVELPAKYTNISAGERRKKVDALIKAMQIDHRRDYFPSQLSGGQQQRVAIARALVNSPAVLLADEPTGNLDSATGLEVMNLLKELNEKGTTIVMVTHSEHDASFGSRRILMKDGQIIQS